MNVRLETSADREASVEAEGLVSKSDRAGDRRAGAGSGGAFAPVEEDFRAAVLGGPDPAPDGEAR